MAVDTANDRGRDLGRKQLTLVGHPVTKEIAHYVEDVVWREFGEAPRTYRQKIGALRHWLQSQINEDGAMLTKLNAQNPNARAFVLSVCENRAKPSLLLGNSPLIESVPTLAPDDKWSGRWSAEEQWKLPETPADSLPRPNERRPSQEASPWVAPSTEWQLPSPAEEQQPPSWQQTPEQWAKDRPTWQQPEWRRETPDQPPQNWQQPEAPTQPEQWQQPEAPTTQPWQQPDAPTAQPWQQPEAPPAQQWQQPEAPTTQPWQQPEAPQTQPWQQPEASPAQPWQQPEAPQTQPWQQPEAPPAQPWQQQEAPQTQPWQQPEAPPAQPWQQPEGPTSQPWQQPEAPSTQPWQQPEGDRQTDHQWSGEHEEERPGWWKAQPPAPSTFILGDDDTSLPSARPVDDPPAPPMSQSMTLTFDHAEPNLTDVRETFNQLLHSTTEGRIAAHADRVHRRTVDEALLAVKSSLGQLPEVSQDLSLVVGELVNEVRQREATFRSSQAEAHGLILKLQESASGIQESVEELNDMMNSLRSDLDAAHRLLIGL